MANSGSRSCQPASLFDSKNSDTFLLCESSFPYNGSRSVLNFEEMNPLVNQDDDEDLDELLHQPGKKRRLTGDQVQFLEKSFALENKLEPERKLQLAKNLNLEPRQVAIWFQNRRARWKTKQLEKDYDGLLASFNTLQREYDLVNQEKQKLLLEVEELKNKLIAKGNGGLHDRGQCKSDNFDPDSPRCASGVHAVDCSNNFEQEHSDLSQDEDDGLNKGLLTTSVFPKPGDAAYSSFEDTSFWSWSFG